MSLARQALNLPNLISLSRLGLVAVFVWLVFGADQIGWAGVLLGIIGGTDWIDGYLARRLGQVTELGTFLDPLADRLAVAVSVVVGLVVGVLPSWFAWALIVREALIGIGALYGWTRGVRRLDVRRLGKLATLLLYFSITGFYLGRGFQLPGLVAAAYLVGVPGLVAYYAVGVQYLTDMRVAVGGVGSDGGEQVS